MTLFAALTLGLAVAPILWVVRQRSAPSRHSLMPAAIVVLMAGSALLAGSWALMSVYLRPVVAVATIAALVAASRRAPSATIGAPRRRARFALQVGIAFLFAVVLVSAIAGRFAPSGTTDLQFPFGEGTYAVLQGGSSLVVNPFHRWFPSDRHGVDLVKVNRYGNRARGISPGRLNDYATFDVPVQSPCAGTVERIENGLPDNLPGATDPSHPPGNHVWLRCGPLRVLLAHLGRGTVTVTAHEAVLPGQVIGRVGNSGNTNEPHLHIGAIAAASGDDWPNAEAVPLTFDGRFLVLNDIVRVPAKR